MTNPPFFQSFREGKWHKEKFNQITLQMEKLKKHLLGYVYFTKYNFTW